MSESKGSRQGTGMYVAFVTLTSLMGMQLIRALIPYFLNVLRDRMGMDTTVAAAVALAIFGSAFLAGPANRFFGSVPTFIITAIVVGFSRLALQLWNYDPLGDMILAATGVFAFLLWAAVALGIARRAGGNATLQMGIGLLLGLALDVAINGAFFSYDLAWQSGWLPAIIVILSVVGQYYLIGQIIRTEFDEKTADAPFLTGISWLFLGPYLFLQMLIFGNFGWAMTRFGLSYATVFALLLVGQLAGLMLILLPERLFRLFVLLLSAVAVFTGLFGVESGWSSILFLVAGQMALSGLFLAAMIRLGKGEMQDGLRNITIAHGFGFLTLVIFLFGFYAGYDLTLPFENRLLPMICFAIVLLCGLPGLWITVREERSSLRAPKRLILGSLLLLLVPLAVGLLWQEPEGLGQETGPSSSEGVRVMVYNIHGGADPKGHIGLEAIAQIIENENPDVVGLQEVSRGWILNGSMDSLIWLAQRLDMVPVFGPAADAQWGNAVLTKLPVESFENIPLPPDDLLLKRAFMALTFDQGSEEPLTLINTHYYHKGDGGEIREGQTAVILDYLENTPHSIVMGDLNAEHGMGEIDMYTEADFGDVLDLTGVVPGYTNPVPDPHRRIDYIFITPDLEASEAVIPEEEASDHLGIAVRITRN